MNKGHTFLSVFIFLTVFVTCENMNLDLQLCQAPPLNTAQTGNSAFESLALTKLRGSVQASEIESSFSELGAKETKFLLANTKTIEVGNFNRFEINSTSTGFYNFSMVEIDDIVIEASDSIDLIATETIQSYFLLCQETLQEVEFPAPGTIICNNGNYRINFSPLIEAHIQSHSQISISFSTENGIQKIEGNSFDMKLHGTSGDIYFNGTFHITSSVNSSYFIKREANVGMNFFDYSHPSIIKLTETVGNFSIGPDDFSAQGFDEIILINSFKLLKPENDLAIQIDHNISNTQKPYKLSFGYLHYEAHITQLLINGEVIYAADIIIQQAPSNEVTLDETRQLEMDLTFLIYNPTRYDLFDIRIIFTEGLGGIFNANLAINNQTPTILNSSYYGFKVDLLPAEGGMTCIFSTDLKSLGGKEYREGDIFFSAENADEAVFPLVIYHTSLLIEILNLLESPIFLLIIPIIGGLIGNSYKKIQETMNKKHVILIGANGAIATIIILLITFILLVNRSFGVILSSWYLLLGIFAVWWIYLVPSSIFIYFKMPHEKETVVD